MSSLSNFPETADIETSSDDYARRFAGRIGAWFLRVQETATLQMLASYQGGTVLDVGGGHGQLTRAFIQNGYHVTVLGSDDVCKRRIQDFVDAKRCQFRVGNVIDLPYANQAFDIVVSYRLLPHVSQWQQLLAELTRVSRQVVMIDYPAIRSVNYVAPLLFKLKKRVEGNTRPFTSFKESELLEVFDAHGFVRMGRYPEFFLPMVLHRFVKLPELSSAIEKIIRMSGLTGLLGSPVILQLGRQSR